MHPRGGCWVHPGGAGASVCQFDYAVYDLLGSRKNVPRRARCRNCHKKRPRCGQRSAPNCTQGSALSRSEILRWACRRRITYPPPVLEVSKAGRESVRQLRPVSVGVLAVGVGALAASELGAAPGLADFEGIYLFALPWNAAMAALPQGFRVARICSGGKLFALQVVSALFPRVPTRS